MTAEPETSYPTESMSAYFLDNLAPDMMDNVRVFYQDGGNLLQWRPCREPDFSHFNVYRGAEANFIPGSENRLLTTLETRYLDTDVSKGEQFYYAVTGADSSGNESKVFRISVVTGVEGSFHLPTELTLQQNYPNPFNPVTIIEYGLPNTTHVNLSIYNTLGQKVVTLVNERQSAGTYAVPWDATAVSSGTYLYKLEIDGSMLVKKMQVLK